MFPIKSVRRLTARLWINNPLSREKIPLKGNMIFNLHFNDGTASIKSSQSSTDAKVTRNGPCIGHKTTMDKSSPARPFLSAFSSLCRNYLCAENTKLLTYLSPNNDKSINKHFFEVVEVVHEAANSSILIMSSFVPYYRPQRSWAKVMFLQASVILSTGGCLPQCMLGYHPPEQTPPRSRLPPQRRPCWEIRSTRGRYASYWNAILFVK